MMEDPSRLPSLSETTILNSMSDITSGLNVSNAIALNKSNESAAQLIGDSTGYLHTTSIRRTPVNMTLSSVTEPTYSLTKKRPKRLAVNP